MTQAYVEGFCKTAEVHGVDPERLIKTAQWAGLFKAIGRLGRHGIREAGMTAVNGARTAARGAGRFAGMASQLPDQAAKGVRAIGRTVGQAARGLKRDFMSGWYSANPININPVLSDVKIPIRGTDWNSFFNSRTTNSNLRRLLANSAGKVPASAGTRGIPGLLQSNTASIVPSRPVTPGLM